MSEETPALQTEPVIELSGGDASLGGRLRTAREKLGLDIENLANQLRLSPRQLKALEANDLEALPSPAFTRGFIRNYARLLQVDPEPLLALYREMVEDVGAKVPITLHSEDIPLETGSPRGWMPYLVASVVLGIAVGGWWAYMDWQGRAPATPAATADHPASESRSVPAEPPVQSEATLSARPSGVSAPAPPAPEAVVPAAEPGQPAAPAVVSTSQSRIVMKFSQPTWVRVLDRDGVEVFHKNKPAGSEDAVEGMPPFHLEIGNAAGVELSYNGQPVDLAPHTKANVARLTLE
jgi:cytoskeleton protein RodZ